MSKIITLTESTNFLKMFVYSLTGIQLPRELVNFHGYVTNYEDNDGKTRTENVIRIFPIEG